MDRTRNLLEQIRSRLEELNKAERKVAEVILQDPQQATRYSIASLAQAAQVSEPTVNRFCRSFGVSGYPELKLQLAQSLASGAAYVSRAVEADDGPEAYTRKIFGSTIASLDSACQALDPRAVDKAVDLLIQARQIHFFGLGASGLSIVFALALAWITIRTDAPWRRLFELIAIIPNILPPILVSISWVMLLNPSNGLINGLFVKLLGMEKGPFNIYSMAGLIYVEALILTPLAFLIVAAALEFREPGLDPKRAGRGGHPARVLAPEAAAPSPAVRRQGDRGQRRSVGIAPAVDPGHQRDAGVLDEFPGDRG